MPLLPGTKLGVYEVTAQIGAGGMGEVYRAHDTTLDRDVAIKVLPDAFATDPERLARPCAAPTNGHRRAPTGLLSRRMPMATLTRAEAEQRMKTLDGWTLEDAAVRKQYTFADFPEAIAFVNRLAPKAEAADHHPDILINYKRVTLTYSTHSEGGLTEKDFAGAAMADRLV